MPQPFSIGDMAVYPVHGLAKVVAMEDHDVGGHPLSVYILKVVDNGSRIMVPTTKANDVGLREPISKDEVPEVYEILRSRDVVQNDQAWNRRQREYMDKIKTGSIFEIAEVLRDLRLLGEGKTLSFSERRMADTAMGLVAQEIAVARDSTKAEIVQEIDAIFTPKAA